MADEGKTRRELLTFPALDPVDRTTYAVQISFDRMQTVAKRSIVHAKELIEIVPPILLEPAAVFQGLRRDEDEDPRGVGWRCYCGIPECAFRSDGSKRPAYTAQVYLVFVNDQAVAYNWRWEYADEEDPILPIGHATRFRDRLL